MDKSENQTNLEEGEIESSCSDDVYIPLKRPEKILEDSKKTLVDQESDDSISDVNNSDSDSSPIQTKKPRVILKATKKLEKSKKYNIWNEKIQEDLLTESLQQCDVTKKDRCRDVESYDYVFSARYHELVSGDRKRSRDDRKSTDFKSKGEKSSSGPARLISDLTTTMENSIEEIARDMSNKLFEEKEDLILKVLHTLGKEKSFQMYKKTQEIEANGGLLILNCKRRRTPGGVFLYIIRMDDNITREDKNTMFNDDVRKSNKEKRRKKIEKLKKQTAEERKRILPALVTDPKSVDLAGIHSENTCTNSFSLAPKQEEQITYDEDFLDLSYSNDLDL